MDKITHEVRLAQWTEVVKECQKRPENMSASAWLKQNSIPEKTYYYWQRRVRNEVFNKVASLAPVSKAEVEVSFAEVPAEIIGNPQVAPSTANAIPTPDAIIKTGHMEIQIHNSLSPMLLKSIMEVAVRAR